MSSCFVLGENRPNNITDCVCEIGLVLERGNQALEELTIDYTYAEKPDITNGKINSTAIRLIQGYNRLENFLFIASDYIWEAKELLKHLQVIDEAERIKRNSDNIK